MSTSVIKNKTVSTRVTLDIDQRAKSNLAKQGLTISEYIRLSLVKAANNEVRLVSFLDSPEALEAKREAETGQVKTIGSLDDFDHWVDQLDAN
ncbi:type II toxin-antitoxin system RelB/DinJ family antitoxin [Oenococcus kitaharae]|uniref:RelB family toxin-antitoxin system, antitoxin component n=1 Tax=Oenococcus kitaharae DSM 17330 TaxID=1045004 RepID=G9WJE7_9LACO|nr:type II toxin-antitoxin system RelB/DinJ family antitoxin [Oenococcus kitaharae]EHN58753.1 RelB family toxin-antitoxin system, antitoxin component [Oenococcus kitaharae DSM 17330]MCV3296737.1 type II toxin-antitoxin system RelB/DinJ family antitoxin [Oenococcus kitaharae]OEY81898.1 RelB [Oenococcus kitaharae]OEY84127.1 RelB [Oenococcus kitaharae]OEY85513.1 RelB [Oenococcus kitaharae]